MLTNHTGAILRSALTAVMGFIIAAVATPADAKSYFDAGSGVWDGYKNGVYVGRTKSASRNTKFAKAAARSGYATKAGPKGKRYAALGKSISGVTAPRNSITAGGGGGSGGVRWAASSGCLNGTLRSVIYKVAASYGSVTVSSTCRSRGHNAAVGGAKRSQHLTGSAVDFRVHGNVRAVYAYLSGAGRVGGFKHYGGGLFHIDTGPRRTW